TKKSMYAKEGFICVALSWIVLSIFGALPFIFSGTASIVDCLFETVSGFTTTGASILSDVEVLPKGLLFWRSFTHWLGGMGVLVFLVAILPLAGGSNLHLIKAESPGPSVGKLVPKVRSTAKILYLMYLALTLIQVVFLLFGGMNLFDALTISFGTAGTGGFGILNSGCADYSPYIQIVITVFMILFGINFSLYYLLLLGKIRDILRSEELKAYLGIIFVAIIVIVLNCKDMYESIGDAIRHTAFQVGAVITTTGFSTTDFDLWPSLSKTIMVLLMFSGAMAGSTGGGIKVSRILILIKTITKEIFSTVHPNATKKVAIDQRPVEHQVVRGVNVYMAAYVIIFAASVLLISIDNFDPTTNFTAVLSAMNNIGPGLAEVGPTRNFSIFSDFSTLVLSADMLIGRLEIFPFLVLFAPSTWRK
ncbi:MAG: TrkH family potassium uptake protein, partial [Clostridia bacterium]|nr:TrkH family potassium uptake protein [Clostridia bacterium]